MKRIKLHNSNRMAIVDGCDFEYLNRFRWSLDYNKNYAIRQFRGSSKGLVRMHEFVIQGESSKEIHHKNGDLLDCRKDNLVVISRSFINHRTRKYRGITSDYCGVCWDKEAKKWCAYISKNRKRYYLGRFKNENKAALAYNEKAKELYEELAIQNIIKGDNKELLNG